MRSPARLAAVMLAPSTLAGCFNVDLWGPLEDVDPSETASETEPSAGSSPISTVTSDTGESTTGSGAGEGTSGDEGTRGSTRGDTGAVDAPPTVELRINGVAEPATIAVAGTQTITATVADDHGLARVQIFVDDAPDPLAEVDLRGVTSEVVEVDLVIADSHDNGLHSVHAVVVDGAMQATTSPAIALEVDLPPGGAERWDSVSPSKFAAKALAVTIDSVGDVIAVGEAWASLDGHRSRIVVRKYRGDDGQLLWEREVPAQKDVATPAGNNVARAVAVDVYDNVYVVGEVDPDGDSKPSLWLGKITHDGLVVGEYVSDQSASRGNGVAVDAAGGVFVVGYRVDKNAREATVDAFNVGLAPLWGDAITGVGMLSTYAYGAAIDQEGNLVVVGSAQVDANSSQGLAALYTADGLRSWWKLVSPAEAQPQERLFSVAVTSDNEYIAVGKRQKGNDPRRLWLFRVDANGQTILSEPDPFAGCGDPNFEDDTDICGVAIGPLDRNHIAGVVKLETDDFLVKRTKADWTVNLWHTAHDGPVHAVDRGLAAAVDADGFVVTAGYETHAAGTRWRVSRQHP